MDVKPISVIRVLMGHMNKKHQKKSGAAQPVVPKTLKKYRGYFGISTIVLIIVIALALATML